MASILEKRKAEIREALEKAAVAYKDNDYETALKILQPYRSDKKVQKLIVKIEAVRQGSKPARKMKSPQQNSYTNVLIVAVGAVGGLLLLFAAMNSIQPSLTELNREFGSSEFAAVYYTNIDGAYVRACTEGDCEILASLPVGEEVDFIETAEGASISDSTVWYRVFLSDGREGYIHSTVVSTIRPTPAPTRRPQATPRPSQPPAPETNWNCSRNHYNCDDFSGCSAIMSYWNSCPGDPSNMDGDSDGRPCEMECGG